MSTEERITNARERVVESIAKNMNLYGVPPSIGRLFGTLYFSQKPMTLDEMKETLQMSKTSMSTSIRTLIDLNCVEKVWKKGERKDYFKAKEDWQQIFIDYFSVQWRKAVVVNLEALNKSKAELLDIINKDQGSQLQTNHVDQASADLVKIDAAIEYYRWLGNTITGFETNTFTLPNKKS